MTKTIKEIIILLLICLILMLLFAIILYDYIPNRKAVKQVADYTASEEIQVLLDDDIDSDDKEVVKTYQVTAGDLTNYSIRKEYVKGKDNPFASIEAHENEVNNNKKKSSGNSTASNDTTDDDVEDENEVDEETIK